MARLPTVGGDASAWGTILNTFLSVEHNNDGTLKAFYDVVAYGADPTGVSDSTTAITNARAAARAAGGGTIFYPAGTYISGNQDFSIDIGVYHVGSGKHATTIKLKNGANTDLFSAQTSSINISASGGTGSQGTLYNFGFLDMTLDGNKANQASGPSYPLRFYGYSYIMQNLEIKNGYSGNVLSDWNSGNNFGTADSMESQWVNVKIHDSNGIGMQLGGPHDSMFTNLIIFNEASHCLHIAPNAHGAMFKNLHCWQPGKGVTSTTTYGVDTFVRANQSGLGNASDTQPWTEAPGSSNVTASIVSNQGNFTGNGSESDSAFTLGSNSVANIDIKARVNLGADTGNSMGLVFHFTDINNYYRAILTGSNMFLQKWVSGTKTTINNTGFSGFGASTYAWIRVQMSGTTIKVKYWFDGQIQPPSWNATVTDSSLASGKFGLASWINSGTGIADNFQATSIRTQSGAVALLLEGDGCQFDGCSAESSDTVQWVLLSSQNQWMGGSLYDGVPSISSGIQVGQQAGNTPYAGQVYQSAGLTQAVTPNRNLIQTYLTDCQGDNGALWLANDGGYNRFELIINQDLVGTDKTGSLASRSELRETYNSGTNVTTGTTQLDSGVQINKASTIYSGSGAPSSTLGSNGDYYLRQDTPGTSYQQIYIKVSGSWVAFAGAPVQSSSAASIASSGTITTSGVSEARVTTSGAVTGVILQAGTVAGQEVSVVNESGNTITFATAATSNVADGTSAVIAANRKMDFTWNSSQSKWYHS